MDNINNTLIEDINRIVSVASKIISTAKDETFDVFCAFAVFPDVVKVMKEKIRMLQEIAISLPLLEKRGKCELEIIEPEESKIPISITIIKKRDKMVAYSDFFTRKEEERVKGCLEIVSYYAKLPVMWYNIPERRKDKVFGRTVKNIDDYDKILIDRIDMTSQDRKKEKDDNRGRRW